MNTAEQLHARLNNLRALKGLTMPDAGYAAHEDASGVLYKKFGNRQVGINEGTSAAFLLRPDGTGSPAPISMGSGG